MLSWSSSVETEGTTNLQSILNLEGNFILGWQWIIPLESILNLFSLKKPLSPTNKQTKNQRAKEILIVTKKTLLERHVKIYFKFQCYNLTNSYG